MERYLEKIVSASPIKVISMLNVCLFQAFDSKKPPMLHINSVHTEEESKEKATCHVCGKVLHFYGISSLWVFQFELKKITTNIFLKHYKVLAIGYIERHMKVHTLDENQDCPHFGKVSQLLFYKH